MCFTEGFWSSRDIYSVARSCPKETRHSVSTETNELFWPSVITGGVRMDKTECNCLHKSSSEKLSVKIKHVKTLAWTHFKFSASMDIGEYWALILSEAGSKIG